jgi:NAD(P)-dependent dehydrogenase (short-subunit alcohol dehydrogenase family)
VHIITGGYAGVGLELAKILYQHNATIWIAGRSKDKAEKAISTIKTTFPNSTGSLTFLQLDLSDLNTIPPAVSTFLASSDRLDVLHNNAGVMRTPVDARDKHGHELQVGTNCLGPFLLTKLLSPLLKQTAASSPAGSVRITWAASGAVSAYSPPNGATFEDDAQTKVSYNVKGGPNGLYGQSKAGNYFLAYEYAKRYGKSDGIRSVSFNPGNLTTELQRHMGKVEEWLLRKLLLHPAKMGAYTELWAACSEDLSESDNGAYVAPWGQVYTVRDDVVRGLKSKEEGGTGVGKKFWDWCEKETEGYHL